MSEQKPAQTLAVEELIDKLADEHPRQAEVAKMQLFLELAFAEIADFLGIPDDAVENGWEFAGPG